MVVVVMMLIMMMMMKTMILVLAIDGPFVGTHHFQGIRYRKAALGASVQNTLAW